MPLDAICLTGVLRELEREILGERIEKVQQPARDQMVLALRGGKKLLLCAGSSQARVHLTRVPRENPAAPPMFCMLLRKHLGGGRITAVTQPALERVVRLTVDTLDELGDPCQRHLVLECMGRHSNLILLDGEERIVECLRRVDMEMSEKRQVLPGLFYRLPPAQEKENPLEMEQAAFAARWAGAERDTPAETFLLDTFFGLSPLVCRELAHRAMEAPLPEVFFEWQAAVREERFTPFLLTKDGRPSDFSYFPILQYGDAMEGETCESFSALLDAFYEKREQLERVRQRGADLHRIASTARDRLRRKLALQEKEYAQTQDRDRLRVWGELITANLHRMEKGQSCLVAQDYYQEGCPEVEIPLNPLLTPQQNAARYFKQYSKAKTAETVLAQQMELARRERDWLESVLDELSRAETEQDFIDIRRELQEAGYGRGQGSRRKEPKRPPSRPRVFRSSGGLTILVGRSNGQNDQLTREAAKTDYWFHTQRIHGSHVILRCEGQAPDQRSMTEAAMLAAWFSQGREGGLVAVDYTQVRNVKKPGGARPGMVVYDLYQTAYVTAREGLVKELAVE